MTVYVGRGFDTTNSVPIKGTSADSIEFLPLMDFKNGMTVVKGTATVGISTDTLTSSGDMTVGGNLTVAGEIHSKGEVHMIVQDPIIDLGMGYYSSNAGDSQGGGYTFTLKAATGFTAEDVDGATAGVPATSNPTFDTTGSTLLAALDVVQLSNSIQEENNGYYVVLSVVDNAGGSTITLKGVGLTGVNALTPFAKNQVTTVGAGTDTAKLFKVDLYCQFVAGGAGSLFAPLDSGATAYPVGTLIETLATGAVESDFTTNGKYTEVGAGATTLQSAYDGGGNIITTSGGDDILFNITSANGGFQVDGLGEVGFGVATTQINTFDVSADGAITLLSDLNAANAIKFNASNAGAGLQFQVGGTNVIALTAALATLTGDLLPEADGTRDLGASGTKFAEVHSTDVYVHSLTADRIPFVGLSKQFADNANLTYDGGSNTLTSFNFDGALNTSYLTGTERILTNKNDQSIVAGVATEEVVYLSATGYAKAQADAVATSRISGIAKDAGGTANGKVAKVRQTVLVTFEVGKHPTTVGEICWLSDTTAGVAVNNANKPTGTGTTQTRVGYLASATAYNTNDYKIDYDPELVTIN